jgi:Helix-turn-helix domain
MTKPTNSPAPVTLEPLRLTIPQAAQMLAISPAQIYRRLQSGELKAQKDGVSTYILPDELRRYVATRAELQLPDPQIKRMSIETAPKRMETRARKRAAAGA